jgi:hypothetical protein
MNPIDFTTWTDAQLGGFPFISPDVDAEIRRRKGEGIWLTDGSTERVARMIRDNTPASRRKLSRRVRR